LVFLFLPTLENIHADALAPMLTEIDFDYYRLSDDAFESVT